MSKNFIDCKKTRAEISQDAIAHNYTLTKKLVGRRVICVVKSDAYGHGAVEISRRLNECGADFFAVATIDEAMELRRSGVFGGILILGYVLPEFIEYAVSNDISLTAASCDALSAIANASHGRQAKVHIKLNTGMNRTGFDVCRKDSTEELIKAAAILKENPNIIVEGIFSHFARAEDDSEFSRLQFENYQKGCRYFEGLGITPIIHHICNSAGLLRYDGMRLDAVRLGITLYGCSDDKAFGYKPAMSFKTTVVDVHDIRKGDGVSYGLAFKAERDMKMAVIGAGYADGLTRQLSCGKGRVLCNGVSAPIIGRVCMDMAMIDASAVPAIKVGDEVIIWGRDGDEILTCDEQAQSAGTISYELLCGVSKRVPRIYI